MHRVRRRDAGVLAGALSAIAATGLVLRQFAGVSPTTVALALLLVVLATATLGRLWIAITVAIVSLLTLNFFFLPPVGTFRIADPQNWVALFAFLVVAVIASKLSAAAQARAHDAIARRNEVTRLFDLTRDVLLTTETVGAIEALARHVARRFDLSGVAVCLPADHDWRLYQGGLEAVRVDSAALDIALTRARGTLEVEMHRQQRNRALVGADPGGVLLVPLRHGTRAVGLLAAVAPALDLGALEAVGGVVAIAIERTQFLAEREAAERARQKADLAATFLASLSHDLKTPLTAIRVAVENLRRDLLSDEREGQATLALVELDRLTRLFQDILDMARIDAAGIEFEPQWVTPADVVDVASAQARHALDGHALRVDADDQTEIEIDPRVASVALSHLLENAAQYSPADREISVEARAQPDGLHVAVTDGGPGLDPAEVDQLFERFYRGRAARHLVPGTGMGLAITRGLLAAAGGRVWGENVPGAGARFTIVIPGRSRVVGAAV